MATSRSRRHPVRVVQWAQEHGEVGGVRGSVLALSAGLRAVGTPVSYLDTGSLVRALQGVRSLGGRGTLHLFHITRLWRAIVLAPVFALLPGKAVLVLHSGSSLQQMESQPSWQAWLLRRSLTAYTRIWAVNDEIGAVLPARVAGRVRVVSPFVPAAPDPAGLSSTAPAPAGPSTAGLSGAAGPSPHPAHRAHLITVATNAGLAHYNALLTVDAVQLVRRDWPDARLWVLAYGVDGPDLADLRARVAAEPWVEVSFDLTPPEVTAALASSEVFLRPTDWDGDSMIVREALAVGTRVVASDVCPRPAGVEIAPLDPASFASVITGGGPVSSGEGLASRSILDFALEAVEAMDALRAGDQDEID